MDLQSKLKTLSLDKLQSIYQYIVKNQHHKNSSNGEAGNYSSDKIDPIIIPGEHTPAEAAALQLGLDQAAHGTRNNGLQENETLNIDQNITNANLLIIMNEMNNRVPQ